MFVFHPNVSFVAPVLPPTIEEAKRASSVVIAYHHHGVAASRGYIAQFGPPKFGIGQVVKIAANIHTNDYGFEPSQGIFDLFDLRFKGGITFKQSQIITDSKAGSCLGQIGSGRFLTIVYVKIEFFGQAISSIFEET